MQDPYCHVIPFHHLRVPTLCVHLIYTLNFSCFIRRSKQLVGSGWAPGSITFIIDVVTLATIVLGLILKHATPLQTVVYINNTNNLE
jgi:hypothetical protein